ncbi:hypothetical protein K470DRAFT_272440 [Piedraia hortae CBS 480.64]|uniref:Phosphatidylserine decarboxylase proenzyme 2 n=1 Tax=Piedraia hortae CBS 480.64 TaxID=1314780 RepID=A0A6A7BSU2_9PEZI|nr:hypothetical protein K470DRAFT_272440 [Piedraia hortae CBS 480.64]
MPRPHITHRLSLDRVKSGNSPPKIAMAGTAEKAAGLMLSVLVIKGRNLAAKDRSGTSDPFLVLTLGDAKQATSVAKKTLYPEWNDTLEFSLSDEVKSSLKIVCWDKDRFGKDYMGEVTVWIPDIFTITDSLTIGPKWFGLESTRSGRRQQKRDADIGGDVQLQFTLYDARDPNASSQQILQQVKGVVAEAEAHEAHEEREDLDLNHVDSRDYDEISDADTLIGDEALGTPAKKSDSKRRKLRLKRKSKLQTYELGGLSDVAGVLFLAINKIVDLPPEKNMTKTGFDMDPFVVASLGKKTYRTRVLRHNLNPVYDEKMIFQVQKHELNYSLSFTVVDKDKFSGNDFVGTTLLPVEKICSLAPEADPQTGLYKLPDPDAHGEAEQRRRKWRVPLSRSASQNHSSRLSNTSQVNLGKLNKSPSNSGLSQLARPPMARQDSEASIQDTNRAPSPLRSQDKGLVEGGYDEHGMYYYELPLDLKKKARWEDKHNPVLYVHAKYLPYRALRQQFWRAMLRQYDADDSGKMDKVELMTMLDTLGSTLHESTIDGFFHRFSHVNGGDEFLTMDQTVICLEEQLMKTRVARSDSSTSSGKQPSPEASPYLGRNLSESMTSLSINASDQRNAADQRSAADQGIAELSHASSDLNENEEEHVVEIQECPICHMPRLSRGRQTTDADIITHIATCASSDWRSVNNLVMAGFVTSSQAQRKWYSKVITKVSYGGYKVGANSANILVQDRVTGMINEERMSVYVRLGIRLLYKGLKSTSMERRQIRKLLRSMSFKQGRKYDDPASASQIVGFINFHRLDMSEVLKPTTEFKTFNEFFYRELKPGARPCSAPDRPQIVVSPADCRTVVFDRLEEAQKIWVKGREFSVERLLGDAYPEDAARYHNGALGIFRLAPQDYHRFHIPVDGVLGEPRTIEGEYYTVNPMAIRSALDVYGENVRVIVPIDSQCHGRVMVICVGAMLVGSTVITRQPGERVQRAEELGYFKFGGSTVLTLFEPGVMKFDSDLVSNSNTPLETLVRVGMSVGHSPNHAPHTPDMQKANPTAEERKEAERKIAGSLSADHDVQ